MKRSGNVFPSDMTQGQYISLQPEVMKDKSDVFYHMGFHWYFMNQAR